MGMSYRGTSDLNSPSKIWNTSNIQEIRGAINEVITSLDLTDFIFCSGRYGAKFSSDFLFVGDESEQLHSNARGVFMFGRELQISSFLSSAPVIKVTTGAIGEHTNSTPFDFLTVFRPGVHFIIPAALKPHFAAVLIVRRRDRNYAMPKIVEHELRLLSVSVFSEILFSRAHLAPEHENIGQLSERQKAILHWISKGKTNWEIATIMEMKRRTVDYHVAAILEKLNVSNRSQAASLLVKITDLKS